MSGDFNRHPGVPSPANADGFPRPQQSQFFSRGRGASDADLIRRNFAALVRASPAPGLQPGLPKSGPSPAQPQARKGGINLHSPLGAGTVSPLSAAQTSGRSALFETATGSGRGTATLPTAVRRASFAEPSPVRRFPTAALIGAGAGASSAPAPAPVPLPLPSTSGRADAAQIDVGSIHHKVQLVRWRVEVLQRPEGSAGPGGAPQLRVVGVTRTAAPSGLFVEAPYVSLLVAGWVGSMVVWDEAPTLLHLAGPYEGVTVPWEAGDAEEADRIALALQDYFVQGFPQNWKSVVWDALCGTLLPVPRPMDVAAAAADPVPTTALTPPQQGATETAVAPAPPHAEPDRGLPPQNLRDGPGPSGQPPAKVTDVDGPSQPTRQPEAEPTRAAAEENLDEAAQRLASPASAPMPQPLPLPLPLPQPEARVFVSMEWVEHRAPDGDWSLRLDLVDAVSLRIFF